MTRRNIFLLSLAAAGLVLLGAGCAGVNTVQQPGAALTPANAVPTQSGSGNLPAAATAVSVPASQSQVTIANFSFQPGSIKVAAGGTVTWTNNDSMPHTVTADDGSFDSGPVAPGATFSRVFPALGTVSYHCSIHASMQGNVTVEK